MHAVVEVDTVLYEEAREVEKSIALRYPHAFYVYSPVKPKPILRLQLAKP